MWRSVAYIGSSMEQPQAPGALQGDMPSLFRKPVTTLYASKTRRRAEFRLLGLSAVYKCLLAQALVAGGVSDVLVNHPDPLCSTAVTYCQQKNASFITISTKNAYFVTIQCWVGNLARGPTGCL
jgi:hypothetical protein